MELELSQHRDKCDRSSPAVSSLPFPIPAIFRSQTMKIMARDHRTGEQHVVKALLRRESHNDAHHTSAYLLKKVMSRSEKGREKTWAAVVLEPISAKSSLTTSGQKSPFGVHWKTSNKIVTVRVCAWLEFSGVEKERLMQEVSALQYTGSRSENVQGCLEILKDDERLYIIMPHCLEQSLAIKVKSNDNELECSGPMDEDKARIYFKQLCTGLLHVQQKGLFHGNICPEQVFLSDNQTVVLGDMSMSLRVPFADPFNEGYVIPQGTTRRLVRNQGSRSDVKYQAPEMSAVGFDAFASDLWAAGSVLFEMITGVPPFKRANASDIIFQAVSGGGLQEFVEIAGINISPEVCNLLQSIFRRRPADRATLSQIMEHPWMLGEAKSPSDELDQKSVAHTLPPFYSSDKMEILRKDIVRYQGNHKFRFDLAMCESLRKEWILRAGGNVKQVSFASIEVLSTRSIEKESCFVPVGKCEQDGTNTPCFQSPPESTESALPRQVSKSPKVTDQATRHRPTSPFKKILRSTKKKIQNVVWYRNRARVDIEGGGPVFMTARSA